MSMISSLTSAFARVGTEFKAIRTLISGSVTGDVSGLATTATNLVSAINEVRTLANSAAVINDTTPSSTTVYSSSKTDSQISTAVAAVVNSSPAALDTLNELATALGNDAAFAATTATALGNRLRVDAAQSLTAPQIAQGQSNLNVPDLTDIGSDYASHNFVTDFTAALV